MKMGGIMANNYDETYNINCVIRALRNKETFELNAGLSGNFELLHTVIDSELALRQANLTERQKQVIGLYWFEDRTLSDVGAILGISYQAVADCVKQARNKLQKVLDKWGSI